MPTSRQRFLALDVFRGMTICFMIIVNTPGSEQFSFAPLKHAAWHGFTPTDLVFPSFLFAVGNAMSFVMAKWNELPQSQVLFKIFKRTAIIFLLGFLRYWFPFFGQDATGHISLSPFSHTRILLAARAAKNCAGLWYRLLADLLSKTQGCIGGVGRDPFIILVRDDVVWRPGGSLEHDRQFWLHNR